MNNKCNNGYTKARSRCNQSFANTAGMACPPGVSSAVCRSDMPGFDASQSYLFSDHFHPTPYGHVQMAQFVTTALDKAGWQ